MRSHLALPPTRSIQISVVVLGAIALIALGIVGFNPSPSAGASTPTVSIGDEAVFEGSSGTARAVTVPVTLADPATTTVTVKVTLAGGTATGGTASPADFKQWATKTVSFLAGQVQKYVVVTVIPDTTAESDETATVTLSSPSAGLTVGDGAGVVTIRDDDADSARRVDVGSGAVAEGDSGNKRNVTARVTLNNPPTSTVTVRATLAGGTATAGSDFTAWTTTKTLTYLAGQVSKTLTVTVIPDTTGEIEETASITLSSPSSGLTIGNATGSIVIHNDDAAPNTTCPTANFPDLSNSAGAGTGYAQPSSSVTCTDTELVVHTNGMPSYTFVPMTPNPLLAKDITWKVPLQPVVAASSTSVSSWFGTVGFSVTGLPIYAAMEGAMPPNEAYGDPIYNGIVDSCDGHTGPDGSYHLHAVNPASTCGFTADPIVGYALDGFPIYGSHGCLDLDCTQIVTFTSGWVRTGNPTTNAWKNYTYQASSDPTVLDKCNGRIGPDGTYRYYATASFPYTFGCFKGTPTVQSGVAAGPMPAMG